MIYFRAYLCLSVPPLYYCYNSSTLKGEIKPRYIMYWGCFLTVAYS